MSIPFDKDAIKEAIDYNQVEQLVAKLQSLNLSVR